MAHLYTERKLMTCTHGVGSAITLVFCICILHDFFFFLSLNTFNIHPTVKKKTLYFLLILVARTASLSFSIVMHLHIYFIFYSMIPYKNNHVSANQAISILLLQPAKMQDSNSPRSLYCIWLDDSLIVFMDTCLLLVVICTWGSNAVFLIDSSKNQSVKL